MGRATAQFYRYVAIAATRMAATVVGWGRLPGTSVPLSLSTGQGTSRHGVYALLRPRPLVNAPTSLELAASWQYRVLVTLKDNLRQSWEVGIYGFRLSQSSDALSGSGDEESPTRRRMVSSEQCSGFTAKLR